MDAVASPIGYPFKIIEAAGTVSETDVYEARPGLCDLGYLREPSKRPDGEVAVTAARRKRVEDYVRKGGDVANTVGRRCLCNALVATIGLAQTRHDGYVRGAATGPPATTSTTSAAPSVQARPLHRS